MLRRRMSQRLQWSLCSTKTALAVARQWLQVLAAAAAAAAVVVLYESGRLQRMERFQSSGTSSRECGCHRVVVAIVFAIFGLETVFWCAAARATDTSLGMNIPSVALFQLAGEKQTPFVSLQSACPAILFAPCRASVLLTGNARA
jgi:hypothetical protein